MAIHVVELKPAPDNAIVIQATTDETPIWWQGEK